MEIKATQVKELREMTGVAMMDCKKALVECEGDIEKALDLLRSNSALKAEKKSSRVAADGMLVTAVSDDYATLVEINSETDFAAKDSNFLAFGDKVKEYISTNKITDIETLSNSDLENDRKALVQTIGENIQLRRISTIEYEDNMHVGLYLHSDSKLASISVIKGGDDLIAKDVAMHVSAFNPLCLSEEDIDKDVLVREKAIYENQAKESGKPKEIMEKMIEGKVKRFLSEVSLLSQGFLKDSEITVGEYLSQNNANMVSFSRLKVGEGIEVEVKDFAEEVAEQLK
ncbi:MAG: elongation factor Ts [Gammaproteobacteria bacterium]|nr:elongation factor Ts [Gammaproteobacteria bacterium]|tara:strand:+ start:1708 stop:2565 length:858 start_codon:yes stop_codon:yes gene_type:complete